MCSFFTHLAALAFAACCIALRCMVCCFSRCKDTTSPLRFSNVLPTFFKKTKKSVTGVIGVTKIFNLLLSLVFNIFLSIRK